MPAAQILLPESVLVYDNGGIPPFLLHKSRHDSRRNGHGWHRADSGHLHPFQRDDIVNMPAVPVQ